MDVSDETQPLAILLTEKKPWCVGDGAGLDVLEKT